MTIFNPVGDLPQMKKKRPKKFQVLRTSSARKKWFCYGNKIRDNK